MAHTILVAGKDMPASSKFVDSLSNSGRFVVVTGPDDAEIASGDAASPSAQSGRQKLLGKAAGVLTVGWNRASPISSRTLLLNAEGTFKKVDEAVLYFDGAFYASRTNRIGIEECASGTDEMILSYQYLTLEVLNRYAQHLPGEACGRLVFLLKEGPSAADAVVSPSLRNGAYAIASPVVAAATSAFAAFAENIVALYGDMPYVQIVLVRGDHTMDIASNDASLGQWLSSYLDSLETQKVKSSAKKSLQWIKPGAKAQSQGFSLFTKK